MIAVDEKRKVGPHQLIVSATQLSSFKACGRQWWFKFVRRLPQLPFTATIIGTATHAVIERFYKADRLGRDPITGAEVDLFPAGWDRVTEKGKVYSLKPLEATLVRRLVTEGIKQGIIERVNVEAIEAPFFEPVIDDVFIQGKIDLLLSDGIGDHKTSKAAKWLRSAGPKSDAGELVPITPEMVEDLSSNCLGVDFQMLTYAGIWLKWRYNQVEANGNDGADVHEFPQVVRLQHNQFIKDPNEKRGVRRVDALVSTELVDQHRVLIEDMSAQMLTLKRAHTDKVKWTEIAGPNESDACMAYGGCPMRGICTRSETEATYRVRVEKILQNLEPSSTIPSNLPTNGNASPTTGFSDQQQPTMAKSLFASRNRMAPPAPTTVPVAASAAPSNTTSPSTPTTSSNITSAPWAMPGCRACARTPGINKDKLPCRICDATQAKRGGVTSAMFILDHDTATGDLIWEVDPQFEERVANAAPPEAAPVANNSPSSAAPASTQVATAPSSMPKGSPFARGNKARTTAATQTAATPETAVATEKLAAKPQPEETASEAPAADKRPVGRPKVQFTLLIDAAMIRGPERPTTTLSEVIAHFGGELARANGVASYYELDAFKRRDALSSKATEIAETLGSSTVHATTGDADSKSLIQSLIPLAGMVISGTR